MIWWLRCVVPGLMPEKVAILMPEPWIFDLDGTLADSSEGILESLEMALNSCGHPILVRDTNRLIGPNLPISVGIANPNLGADTITRVVEAYRSHYNLTGHKKSKLYPGAVEALTRLAAAKHPIYILTNKIQKAADIIARHLGLDQLVDHIYGQDASEQPKPDRLMAIVRKHGLKEGVLVGDGLDDYAAARQANFRFLLAMWGYGTSVVLREHGPVAGLNGLEEIAGLL
ncbi:MAG: HAD family hydrolase [Planctomycetota bacterium]|nr:MAG: HAD family hydrolase [Planctomycetota bacterium]